MSADPTYDFLSSAGNAAPAGSGDPTHDFLASGGDTSPVTTHPIPPIGTQFWDTLKSIPGGIAHQAGNLVDVGANAVRAIEGKPTVTPNSPESYAAKFSAPFGPTGDYSAVEDDLKQKALREGRVNFQLPQGPFRQTLEDYGPQALEAVGTVEGVGGKLNSVVQASKAAKAAAAIEQGHPLTSAAQAEAAEMQTHAQAAEQAGVKLPPREVTPAQQYVDNAARTDLKLPQNAPVTSGLLEQARKQYVQPAYDAAKGVPEYTLGPKYQEAIKGVDLTKIEPDLRPPTGGTMDGKQAVTLSQNLRHEANAWYDYAEGAGGPAARATAKAYRDAYKAVESGFRENATTLDAAKSAETGATSSANTAIADNWDKARTYAAKTYAWEETLDGAGHAAGPKVKKLMAAGEPISGPMKEAASVVAQYPELFKNTRLQTPQPGLVKRGAAAIAPIAGAGIGGWLGGGPGAMAGEGVGRYLGDKVIGR